MLKKKILTISLATIISVGAAVSFNPTKVAAVGPDDFAGIIVDVGKNVIIPHLHQLANRDQANGGSDVEFKYFIPPKFEEGKFCISAFNYFNPKGTNTIYTVKAYPKNDPESPSVYNLKSGDMLELNTGVDTPEYILEFYRPGETTPFENYYLSKEFKNKNYGIALAQNNNVYYLKKETGTVYNEEMIEFYSKGKYNQYYGYLRSKRNQFIDNILRLYPKVRNQLFRQSRKISKGNMSSSEFAQNSNIAKHLKYWQDSNYSEKYLYKVEAIKVVASLHSIPTPIPIPTLTPTECRVIAANDDITIKKSNVYHIDNSTIGIKPNGYLTYRIPIVKSAMYKISGDLKGTGKLTLKSKNPYSGKWVEETLSESFTSVRQSPIHLWLKQGIIELKLINNTESDIKFEGMKVEYAHD